MKRSMLFVMLACLPLPSAWAAPCDVGDAVRAWAGDWSARDTRGLREDIAFEFHVTDTGRDYRAELGRDGRGRVAPARKADYATRFSADSATFCAIAEGRMNALTAMVQAIETDPIPLVPDIAEAYETEGRLRGELIPAWFHFFTRGTPERIRYGAAWSREAHGGQAVPLYYKDDLRTSWYGLQPGMHINRDPRDQVNDFDSLFVVIAGTVHARLGSETMVLRKGDAVFVPEGMTHEFWAEDEAGEFILVMTGKNA